MNWKNKKILVLGGAGFIGSHFVDLCVQQGAKVTVVDNFSRGKKRNLSESLNKIVVKKKDLRIEKGLKELFEGHEVIVNFAALNTGIDFDKGRTEIMFEENMLLQLIPLRVASKISTIKKYVLVSTASVYSREAMEKQVPTPEHANTFDPEPTKLGYALAKRMGEQLAQWYAQHSKLNTHIVRFINVYGPRDHFDDLGHFIPMMIRKFSKARKKVTVFGSGQQKRSFIYVSDVVNAVKTVIDKGESGEIYNIDSQQEKSIKEVTKLIQKKLQKGKVEIVFDQSMPEGSQRRMLDNTKLLKLGWKPQCSFEEGLTRTIADIQSRLES